jgi:hypothetical protein
VKARSTGQKKKEQIILRTALSRLRPALEEKLRLAAQCKKRTRISTNTDSAAGTRNETKTENGMAFCSLPFNLKTQKKSDSSGCMRTTEFHRRRSDCWAGSREGESETLASHRGD